MLLGVGGVGAHVGVCLEKGGVRFCPLDVSIWQQVCVVGKREGQM